MNEDEQPRKETLKIEHYEDEIKLTDILRVIWKWKYSILIGIIVSGFAAAIISFNMPKVYRIDMILQPGIVSINESGNKVYIDSVENIKTIIQTNVLKNEIVKYLQEDERKNLSESLKFKVFVPKQSEIIKISYESKNVEFGINVMEAVYQALRKNYSELVKYYQANYDQETQNVKDKLDVLQAEEIFYEQRFKSAQKRIKELEAMVIDISNNNRLLVRKRNEIVQKKENEEKYLSIVIYDNMIQQNQSNANQYRNDIKEYLYIVEEKDIKSREREFRKQELLKKIRMLEQNKSSVQNIKILQSPTATAHPIKPKTKVNVLLSLVIGAIFMVFLSFLLEYLIKFKNKESL